MNNINVINKDDNKIYFVYDIVYNKNGYPCFLIYKDEQWIRIKAKHFRPLKTNDLSNLVGKYFTGG